jgi:hypothetical protein
VGEGKSAGLEVVSRCPCLNVVETNIVGLKSGYAHFSVVEAL